MDVNEYLGLPYRAGGRDRTGVDCWGLVRLVLRERFGLDVPEYAHGYDVADADRVEGEITAAQCDWQAIPAGSEQAGDVLLLRMFGQPIHVGLVIGQGRFLHVRRGYTATTEHYRGPRALTWRRRVEGFYRWRELHA